MLLPFLPLLTITLLIIPITLRKHLLGHRVRCFVFVLFEVVVHHFCVHQAERPVHAVFFFAAFHEPVELAEVAFVSQIKSKCHARIALSDMYLAHLRAMITLSIAFIQLNFRMLWHLRLLLLILILFQSICDFHDVYTFGEISPHLILHAPTLRHFTLSKLRKLVLI